MGTDDYAHAVGPDDPVTDPHPPQGLPEYRPPTWAWPLVFAIGLAWLGLHMSPGVAASAWYGPLLGDVAFGPAPSISRFLAQTALAGLRLVGSDHAAPVVVNGISVVLGAAACAAAAWIAMRIAGRWATEEAPSAARAIALTAGSVTAALLLTSPGLTRVATAAHPATLTLSCALFAIAAWVAAVGGWRTRWSVAAGLAAGLAAANHPGVALLIPVLVIGWMLGASAAGRNPAPGATALAGIALAAACIPVWAALIAGRSLHTFLAGALMTPYPTPGDGAIDAAFGATLAQATPLRELAFAPLAIPLLFHPRTRGSLLAIAAVFLAFGPLFPALTNQYGAQHVLRDIDAPRLAPAALACVASGLGAALCIAVFARPGAERRLTAAGLAIAGILAAAMSPEAVDRRHGETETVSTTLVRTCPPDAVLITTDDLLHSVAVAGRFIADAPGPLAIIPLDALSDDTARVRLAATAPELTALSAPLSLSASWDRWQREQPGLIADLIGKPDDRWARRATLAMLAVWDHIRAAQGEEVLYVAGPAPAWLSARCGPAGLLLRRPYVAEPDPDRSALLRDVMRSVARAPRDPDHADVVGRILTALAANARHRSDAAQAGSLASKALALRPTSVGAAIELMLAHARAGDAERAIAGAEQVLRLEPEASADALSDQVKSALETHALVSEFGRIARTGDPDADGIEELHHAATALWYNEELAALAQGYAVWLERSPDEPTALYERAAALTQLGQLQAARTSLVRVLEVAPFEAAMRLRHDGRFYQYSDDLSTGEE